MPTRPPIYDAAHRLVQRHEKFAARLDTAAAAWVEYRYPPPEASVLADMGKAVLLATTFVSAVAASIGSATCEAEVAEYLKRSRGDVTRVRIDTHDPFLRMQHGFTGLQFDDGTEISTVEYSRTLIELERQWEEQKDSLPPDVIYPQNPLQ